MSDVGLGIYELKRNALEMRRHFQAFRRACSPGLPLLGHSCLRSDVVGSEVP